MNKFIIIFLPLLMISTNSKSTDIERYKDFQFSPMYGDKKTIKNASVILNKYLTGWRTLQHTYAAVSWNNKIVIAYSAGINDKNISQWLSYKNDRLLKKLDYDTDWSAIAIFKDQKQVAEIDNKINNLFPNGHYSNDYYGCIELNPLFTAQMIEGRVPALFTITGIGDKLNNSGVLDRLTLNIYGDNLSWRIKENLFLANFNPRITTDVESKFNYYSYSQELPKKHPLSNNDNRGRKKYAKLFVYDFNQDGLLEVLFWHRQYYSTLVKNASQNGFIMERQWFTYYVENKGSFNFVKNEIDKIQAESKLKKYNFKWNDGYPKNNKICEDEGYRNYKMMPLVIDDDI